MKIIMEKSCTLILRNILVNNYIIYIISFSQNFPTFFKFVYKILKKHFTSINRFTETC